MSGEVRAEFHRELERLDISVASLLGLIPEAIASATEALLRPDPSGVDAVEQWRSLVEDIYGDVEHTIEVVVARQSPVAGDLRFLLGCVRIVPGLHEVVDLIADVAAPGRRHISPSLTPRIVALTGELGHATSQVWATVEDGWSTRRPDVAKGLRREADAIAELRSVLGAELASGAVPLPVALEMAVVSRTYDRLVHHGLVVAARLRPLSTGAVTTPPG